MKLLCIDPARVHEFWRFAEPLIRKAIERGRVSEFAPIRDSVLNGRFLLWIVWDGTLRAAVVTEVKNKVCTIVACGGRGFPEWGHLISDIEDYARKEGCRVSRIYGREGWKRLLDYRVKSVTLEKVL